MRIEIISPGKTKTHYIQEGIDEYSKRLNRYVTIESKATKEFKGKGNESLFKEKEGKGLLSKAPKNSLIVALDPSGTQVDSEKFADLITTWEGYGKQAVAFIIGGPNGLSEEVLRQADYLLSLSKMTFTHDMVRLILLEQVYRAYTIKAGTSYHK